MVIDILIIVAVCILIILIVVNARNKKNTGVRNAIATADASKDRTTDEDKEEVEKLQQEEPLDKSTHIKENQIETVIDNKYEFPPLSLLRKSYKTTEIDKEESDLEEMARQLSDVFASFGVKVEVIDIERGPTLNIFYVQPAPGVKVSKIVGLADDIRIALTSDVSIETSVPGKSTIGIQVRQKDILPVSLRECIESFEFLSNTKPSSVPLVIGKDMSGNVIVADIKELRHLLVAGTTGSGKTVFVNNLIMSIIYKKMPNEVRLILIDTKAIELSRYNGTPHLLTSVKTSISDVRGAVRWAAEEADNRYRKIADAGVRNIESYNSLMQSKSETSSKRMYRIVVIIDDIADIIQDAAIKESLLRITQYGGPVGINLVAVSQRPSVDALAGMIKANMPSRCVFSMASSVDSRVALDVGGAEKLHGKGDMLYSTYGLTRPLHVQGAYISDVEISAVIEYLKMNGDGYYDSTISNRMKELSQNKSESANKNKGAGSEGYDEYFVECGKMIISSGNASIGTIQRKFNVGFNRAARILDQLEEAGVVSKENGSKPRKVLMGKMEFEEYLKMYGG